MKKIQRLVACLLAALMLIQVVPMQAAAAVVDKVIGNEIVIQNSNIKVSVNSKTGRFGITTVDGQPARKNDQGMSMTFGADDPDTSFTTFRINGTDYIFGNSYNIDATNAGFSDRIVSELGDSKVITPEEYPGYVPDGCKAIMTPWSVEGVDIDQIILLYPETDKENGGNVNVYYYIKNNSGADVTVGSRILLDTQVGANDGPQFQLGTISGNTLKVERKLTKDPVNDQGIAKENANYFKIPDYWVMKDSLDPTNPLATNVIAYGYTDISLYRPVDYMIVGHWNHLANYKYDLDAVKNNLDFTSDKNDYGTADSAVAFYWEPETIAAGGANQLGTIYGLGEIIDPTSVFSITFPSPVNQLEVNDDGLSYKNDGVFNINVEVENLAMYNMKHDQVDITLTLDKGLHFVALDSAGNVIRDADGNPKIDYGSERTVSYFKPATAAQAAAGELNPIVPGEIVATSFTVVATGKSWPTTCQYMVTATSPQLETEFEKNYGTAASDDVKAMYNSSRASFVFLPGVGEGTPTQSFAVSPDECFTTDTKYLAVTMTNIEAYNPGSNIRSQKCDPNFNLYLVEKVTGKRYKVDVISSVTTVTTDDGATGEMRISYKNGSVVDTNGNVLEVIDTPELPVGEYYIEVDYISSDDDENGMLDMTTSQTFLVTANEAARVREPAILGIFKSTMDFSSDSMIEQFTKLIDEITAFINKMDEATEGLDSDDVISQITDGIYGSIEDTAMEFMAELLTPLENLFEQLTAIFKFTDISDIEAICEQYPELSVINWQELKGYNLLDAFMGLMDEQGTLNTQSAGELQLNDFNIDFALKGVDLDAIMAGPTDANGEFTAESLGAWATEVSKALPFITDTVDLVKAAASGDNSFIELAGQLVTYLKNHVECSSTDVDLDAVADLISQGAALLEDGFDVDDITEVLKISFVQKYIKQYVAELFSDYDIKADDINVTAIANLIKNAIRMAKDGFSTDLLVDSIMDSFSIGILSFDNGEVDIQSISDILKKLIDLVIDSVSSSSLDTDQLLDAAMAIYSSEFVQAYVKDLLDIDSVISKKDLNGITDLLKNVISLIIDSVNSGDVDLNRLVDIIMCDYVQGYIKEALELDENDVSLDNVEELVRLIVGMVTNATVTTDDIVAIVKTAFVKDCVKDVLEIKDDKVAEFNKNYNDFAELLSIAIAIVKDAVNGTVDLGNVAGFISCDFTTGCLASALEIEESKTAEFRTRVTEFTNLIKTIAQMTIDGDPMSEMVATIVTNDFIRANIREFFKTETTLTDAEVSGLGDLVMMVLDFAMGRRTVSATSDSIIGLLTDLYTNTFVQKYVKEYFTIDSADLTDADLAAIADLFKGVLKMALGENAANVDNIVDLATNPFIHDSMRSFFEMEDLSAAALTKENTALNDLLKQVFKLALGETQLTPESIADIITNDFIQEYVWKYLKDTDVYKMGAETYAAYEKEIGSLGELVKDILELITTTDTITPDTIIAFAGKIISNDLIQYYLRDFLEVGQDIYKMGEAAYNEYKDDVLNIADLLEKTIRLAMYCSEGTPAVNEVISRVSGIIANPFVQEYVIKNLGNEIQTKLKDEADIDLGKVKTAVQDAITAYNSGSAVSAVRIMLQNELIKEYVIDINDFDVTKADLDKMMTLINWGKDIINAAKSSNRSVDSIVGAVMNQSALALLADSLEITVPLSDTLNFDSVTELIKWTANTAISMTDFDVVDCAKSFVELLQLDASRRIITKNFELDSDSVAIDAIAKILTWGIDTADKGFSIETLAALIKDKTIQDFVIDCISEFVDLDAIKAEAEAAVKTVAEKAAAAKAAVDEFIADNRKAIDAFAELLEWNVAILKNPSTFGVDKVNELLENTTIKAYITELFELENNGRSLDVVTDILTWALPTVQTSVQTHSFDISCILTLLQKDAVKELVLESLYELSKDPDVTALVNEVKKTASEIAAEVKAFKDEHKQGIDALIAFAKWGMDTAKSVKSGSFNIGSANVLLDDKDFRTFALACLTEDAELEANTATALIEGIQWCLGVIGAQDIKASDITALAQKKSLQKLICDSLEIDPESTAVKALIEMAGWGAGLVENGPSVAQFQNLLTKENTKAFIMDGLEIKKDNVEFQFVIDILNWSLGIAGSQSVGVDDIVTLISLDSVGKMVETNLDLKDAPDLSDIADVIKWVYGIVMNGISVDDLSQLMDKKAVKDFVTDLFKDVDTDLDLGGIVDILKAGLSMAAEGTVTRDGIKAIIAGDFVESVIGKLTDASNIDAKDYDLSFLEDLVDIAFDITEGSFGKADVIRIIKLFAAKAITYTDEVKMGVACVGVVCRLMTGGSTLSNITGAIDSVIDEICGLGEQIADFFTGKYDYAELAQKLLTAAIEKILDKLGPYRDMFQKIIDAVGDIESFDVEEFGDMILDMGLEAGKMQLDKLIYEYVRKGLIAAATILDSTYKDNWDTNLYPTYYLKSFDSEEDFNTYISETFPDKTKTDGLMVKITGVIKQVGTASNAASFIVDTSSEPAIINDVLCFEGSDLTFSEGAMSFGIAGVTVGGLIQKAQGVYKSNTPLFNSLIVAGDGTLYMAGSGFTIHEGDWSIDFYDGFDKILDPTPEQIQKTADSKAPEDTSLNGSSSWAIGGLGDLINPLRALAITDVYINRHSLFSAPSFSVAGFSLKFDDYLLRSSQISVGGHIDFKIVKGEINNVYFSGSGLEAIEADLKIGIDKNMGLIGNGNSMNGDIGVHYYSDDFKDSVVARGGKEPEDLYSIKVNAELEKVGGVYVELAFKRVADGRILPDVIAFGSKFSAPGVVLTAGVFLTGIRGAIRELADTIAGGSNDVPLTIEAGIDVKFGVAPAEFNGSVDMILKRTGIELNGKLDFKGKKMITEAQIKAQWVTPWFVSAKMEVDVCGLGIILGSFRLTIAENIELNRTDFEGFISAKVVIPSQVPIIGGMPLAKVAFGVNNDKIWGTASISLILVSIDVGITYYWNGGIEFSTNGEGLPDAYNYLLLEQPDGEPILMAIGSGMTTEATSYTNEETIHEITYCAIDDGVTLIDNGQNNIGIGGIEVTDKGRTHIIPVGIISDDRDAVVEIEYYGDEMTAEELTAMFTVTDANGEPLTIPGYGDYVFQVGDLENPVKGDTACKQELETADGVERHMVYAIVPQKVIGDNDTIIVKSNDRQFDSKLISTPIAASVENVEITGYNAASGTDTDFDVTVTLDHPVEGDIVNLYLTREPMGTEMETLVDENGKEYEVVEANDPGAMIFKALPIDIDQATKTGTVTQHIDLTDIEYNEVGDIRKVLESGNYYVRAELKGDSSYSANVSDDSIVMVDPLAPTGKVTGVKLEPAGNGYFNLSFNKSADAECYRFDFLDDGGDVYGYYNGLIFEASDLDEYLSADGKRYENLRLGGWTIYGKPLMDEDGNMVTDKDGNIMTTGEYPSGLETGEYYQVNVYAANKDDNDSYHYAAAVSNGSNTLLPVPVLPKITGISENTELTLNSVGNSVAAAARYLTVTSHKPVLTIDSDVDCVIDAYIGEDYVGTVDADGNLRLDALDSDGDFCIELRATNKATKDVSVTILYLTIDTIAPAILVTSPLQQESYPFSQGVVISGQSTAGSRISLNYNGKSTVINNITKDGDFSVIVYPDKNKPSAKFILTASDAAGNTNVAEVTAINSEYKAPIALVLRKIPTMAVGATAKLEAFLRYADGYKTDSNGDPLIDENGMKVLKYREVPMTAAELANTSFSVTLGEGITVSDNGTVTAKTAGRAGLVTAVYTIDENVSLTGNLAVTVAGSSSSTGGTTTGGEEGGSTSGGSTSGGTTGGGTTGGGTSGGGTSTGGGGGAITGGGGATAGGAADVVVNGQTNAATLDDNGVLNISVEEDDVPDTGKGLKVETTYDGAAGYNLSVDEETSSQLAAGTRDVEFDTPLAYVDIPADKLTGDPLRINISYSDRKTAAKASTIINKSGATPVENGEGVTIDMKGVDIEPGQSVDASVRIPDGVPVKDVTAVLFIDENGNYTNLPWKINMDGNTAYADVKLPGSGTVVFATCSTRFIDVPDSYWAAPFINLAASKLIVAGKGNNRFDPKGDVTRAEFLSMMLRSAGLMANEPAENKYTDVKDTAWYASVIGIGTKLGIFSGSNGKARPDDKITRQEAMIIVAQILRLQSASYVSTDPDADIAKFLDKDDVSTWAKPGVATCVANGIIAGSNGNLMPLKNISRAEAATIAINLEDFIIRH